MGIVIKDIDVERVKMYVNDEVVQISIQGYHVDIEIGFLEMSVFVPTSKEMTMEEIKEVVREKVLNSVGGLK